MTARQAEGIEWRARRRHVHIPFLPMKDDSTQHLTKAEADMLIQKLSDRHEVITAEWLNSLGRQPPVRPFPFRIRLLASYTLTRPRASTISTLGLYITARPPSPSRGMVDSARAPDGHATQDGV